MAKNQITAIVFRLFSGETLTVEQIVDDYGVSIRTAQRFLLTIKETLEDTQLQNQYQLARTAGHYRLQQQRALSEGQVLVLAKLITASRTLNKDELLNILAQLMADLPEPSSKILNQAIANEKYNYHPIADASDRVDRIWQIQSAIHDHLKLRFNYQNNEISERAPLIEVSGQPTVIRQSDYYFFMTLHDEMQDTYQTYRIDWMSEIQVLNRKFDPTVVRQYQVAEKQVEQAYAYDGKDITIEFEYYGYPGYVLDRFPKSRVVKVLDKPRKFDFPVTQIQIDVEYSLGIQMWLMTQSNILRVIKPVFVAKDVKDWLQEGLNFYKE
ncbi:helix-turn-helix transcriptional regulator [Lacticaseibacillus brantae]|nr:WYL domain-containing protein [Lacticaseibacillus brantae]